MKVKGDRDSLLDHDKFKVFLVEVLGFKTSEKIYNFMVFRHFHLMDEVDKLVCGNHNHLINPILWSYFKT